MVGVRTEVFMFSPLSPSDFVVAEDFRWRGLVYKRGSGLPAGIPQGAIHQFLRRDPPLIEMKNGKLKQQTKKKASKKKASKKKVSKRG
jgi:hypothetical protein